MCGIVGCAGNLFTIHDKIFRDMLVLDSVRGFDSTGVMLVLGKDDEVVVEKAVGLPDNLWRDTKSQVFNQNGITKYLNKVMLGHNRAATVGEVTKENAHPFTFGDITGVHNGSLSYYKDLIDDPKFDVDSQALINTIDKKGIDYCWQSFWGAAALVWWDANEKRLNFVRNSERPLWFATNTKEDVLYWASEKWMIDVAVTRHREELKKEKGINLYVNLEENKLYSYEITNTKYELKESRELKKRTYQIPATTTISTVGTGRGKTGAYKGPLGDIIDSVKLKHINSGWSADTLRADKGHKDRRFKLICKIDSVRDNKDMYYILGEFVDGKKELIKIYPSTGSELSLWIDRLMYRDNLLFKTLTRPRVSKVNMNSFHILGSNTAPAAEVVVMKEDEDNVIPFNSGVANELVKKYEEAGSCCAWCNAVLEPKEHNSHKWIAKDIVLCEDCKDRPEIEEYAIGFY